MKVFTLEKWDKKYTDDLAFAANNPKIAENLRNVFPNPYTKEDAESFIAFCMGDAAKNEINRAIVADGKAIGGIGIVFQSDVNERCCELGYWLGQRHWGQGIATAAVGQICAEVFKNTNIIRIYAEVFAHNTGSRRVLEKAGFAFEGTMKNSVYKNGEILDSCMYALLK